MGTKDPITEDKSGSHRKLTKQKPFHMEWAAGFVRAAATKLVIRDFPARDPRLSAKTRMWRRGKREGGQRKVKLDDHHKIQTRDTGLVFAGSCPPAPALPAGAGVDWAAAAGPACQDRSAQELGNPWPHGDGLGPPVSGVAGAIFEWSLGCDSFASCVAGASFVWPLGRVGPRAAWLMCGSKRILYVPPAPGHGVTPRPEGRRGGLVRHSQTSVPDRPH